MPTKQSVQVGVDALILSRRKLASADATVMELEAEMMAMDMRDEMQKRIAETDEGRLITAMFPDFQVTWYQGGRVGFTIVDNTLRGSIQVTDRGRIILDRMAEALDRMLTRLAAKEGHRNAGPTLASIKLEAPT